MTGNLAQQDTDGLPLYIKELMIAAGLRPTVRQLAIKCGVSYTNMYSYLIARKQMPVHVLRKLAQNLNATMDDIATKADIA